MITHLSPSAALTPPKESGADHLRRVVATLNGCREDALRGLGPVHLINLVDACHACDWVVLPSDLPKNLRDNIGRFFGRSDSHDAETLARVNAWCAEHLG